MALSIYIPVIEINYTRNPIVCVLSSDNAGNTAAFARCVIQVNNAAYGSTPEWSDVATTDRRLLPGTPWYSFDISNIINDYINKFDYLIEDDFDVAKLCTKTIRNFRLTFTEYFDNSDASETIITQPEFYAIKGGLKKFVWGKSTDFFTGFAQTSRMWLTWLPATLTIGSRQPVFLTWFNVDNELKQGLALRTNIKYLDSGGNIQTAIHDFTDIFSDFVDLQTRQMLTVPVGVQQLNLESITGGGKIVSYDVQLICEAAEITEIRYYNVDQRTWPFTKYFAYINSLGGLEFIRCVGKADQKADISSVLAAHERDLIINETMPDFTSDSEQAERFEYNILEDEIIKVFSGPKTKAEVQCFRDFLLSPWKREFIPTQGYIPIILDQKSVQLIKDGQQAPSFNFQYRYADQDAVFTPSGKIPFS